jgi:DNA repair protein RadC
MKGADEILYAPIDELVEPTLTPNREPRRSRTRRTVVLPEADLYAGMEKFLVRTALIRAEGVNMIDLLSVASAEAAAELTKHLRYADQEYLITLALNAKLQLHAIHEVGVGPSDHVATTTQHLIKVGLLTSSRAIIMLHNHPSGDPRPSPDDARTTEAAARACQCVGIDLMDHVIVADAGFVSFADNGSLFDASERYSVSRFTPMRWRR